MSKKISDQTNRIKNKVQQAESHSKIEAKLNNEEIRASTTEVKKIKLGIQKQKGG
jgi:hypothetical protein